MESGTISFFFIEYFFYKSIPFQFHRNFLRKILTNRTNLQTFYPGLRTKSGTAWRWG
ncbi:hypothetical protein EVA_16373 [gut metagenome]|uniref:Uncharacterized protein n=1 Tax=gut metagenome TaxID=749906 RepID=J9G129_9ZZZZ